LIALRTSMADMRRAPAEDGGEQLFCFAMQRATIRTPFACTAKVTISPATFAI
jgi:hypothetical protein